MLLSHPQRICTIPKLKRLLTRVSGDYSHLPIGNISYIRRIIPSFTDLLLPQKLAQFIESQEIPTQTCQAKVNTHTLTLISKKHQKVYKLAHHKRGSKLINNHYKSLSKFSHSKIPRPLSLITKPFTLSTESYLKGETLADNQLSLSALPEIIKSLSIHYQKTHREISILQYIKQSNKFIENNNPPLSYWSDLYRSLNQILSIYTQNNSKLKINTSLIHGDLTHHNIIQTQYNYCLIDFERSRQSFPEFDIMMYWVYYSTYQNRKPTYHDLFREVSKLLSNPTALAPYLGELPEKTKNHHISIEKLCALFAIELLLLTLPQLPYSYHPQQQLLHLIQSNLIN